MLTGGYRVKPQAGDQHRPPTTNTQGHWLQVELQPLRRQGSAPVSRRVGVTGRGAVMAR